MKNKASRGENPQLFESMATMHRWKFSALAAATLASVAFYAPGALALSLGPVTVQSALGEPLRAEIELPNITAAEADSLKVGTAASDTFRAQGMEYSGVVSQIQIALQAKPGGRTILRLSSSRPVNDPFVDLIIDATWATGRITRSYTMLFDPPAVRRPAPTVTAAPQLSAPGSARAQSFTPTPAPARAPVAAASDEPSAAERAAAVRSRRAQTASAPARAPVPAPAPVSVAAAPRSAPDGASVTVKSGDTAGRIANANRPQGVSLDQMLVALLRSNPDAFIDGNVNRVKAGAVLQMPDAEQARATPATEARQTIAAQSRDFNQFRRQLAVAAPAAQAPSSQAGQSASGQVQTQVQESTAASASPDKLTLSKGAVKGTQATPEALAQRKQASEASARVEELAKNIEELNKLSGSTAPATVASRAGGSGASSAPGADTPAKAGIAVPGNAPVTAGAAGAAGAAAPKASADLSATNGTAPTVPSATATPTTPDTPADASAPASAAASASAPAPAPASASASVDAPSTVASGSTAAPLSGTGDSATSGATPTPPAPAPAAAVAPIKASTTPVEEPSLLDTVLEEPLIPAAVFILLLLLGYGGYRVSQNRRNAAGVDSSFMESRLQPDSFFGASGGQQINTTGNETTTGSSMAFSPSQLDAGGDVDPVAEADVYLAYGRDLQAEEILKEAVRHNPDRLSVHTKLADIYAKRQDRKALEVEAKEVHRISNGEGTDWHRVCELGRDIDPDNRYYQPGGQLLETPEFTAPTSFVSTFGSSEGPPSMPADLDLDLDLDLPDDALTEPSSEPPAPYAGAAAGLTAAALASASRATNNITDEPAMDAKPLPAWTPPGDRLEPAWAPPKATSPAPAQTPVTAAPLLPPTPAPAMAPARLDSNALDFSMDLPSVDTEPQELKQDDDNAFVLPSSAMMDFDMSSLSLDLEPAADDALSTQAVEPTDLMVPVGAMAPTEVSALTDDPLTTKLELAHEFTAIGDRDGARALIEEVMADASGELKLRAQRMLKELN